ncbi:metallophosphoesterase family protein [Clostridium butyricum]|uniref:Phosphohydrolase n=1 Tax=Clostridium butyricum TaxID=1492 RepID=A0A2S7F9Y3_CLOBU|nr:metallophosphoesterase [Clostridium butyricum]KHD14543.1 phosphohydrolase [Clostridium butyricum]PPV14482.1 phosphohydrolase [Clostridium butyricum]
MNIKRITLISFLILIISIVFFECSVQNTNVENTKSNLEVSIDKESTNNADLSFVVLGDIHDNTENFEKAIDDFYSINSNIDALILNGDNVDQGVDKQYTSLKNSIIKKSKKLPETIIKNIGNHEFYNYDMDTNSKEDIDSFTKKYLKFSETEKVYHDNWIKGYHFISLGSDNVNSEDLNTTQASLSEEQLSWLKEKLSFLHQPVTVDFFGRVWTGVRQADELNDILSSYPEVIIFLSHTHKEFGDDSINENKPFTMAYTGAVGYTLVNDANEENGRRRDNDCDNGVYIQVNGNEVTLKGRDIENHNWVYSKILEK